MVTTLVNNLDPNQVFNGVPEDKEFEEIEFDFLKSDDIAEVANLLIRSKMQHLGPVRIEYFWKQKGGSKGGNRIVGTCKRPSGILKHYCPSEIIIWLAADHVRELKLTRFQVEAAVYHELNHIEYGPEGLTLRGHDFEGFGTEIQEYGTWTTSLKIAEAAVQEKNSRLAA
jgi:hypothetical protein